MPRGCRQSGVAANTAMTGAQGVYHLLGCCLVHLRETAATRILHRLYCGCTGDRASIVVTSSLGVVASWCHSVHEPSYIATLSYPCKYKAIATPAAETPPPHVATREEAWSAPIS